MHSGCRFRVESDTLGLQPHTYNAAHVQLPWHSLAGHSPLDHHMTSKMNVGWPNQRGRRPGLLTASNVRAMSSAAFFGCIRALQLLSVTMKSSLQRTNWMQIHTAVAT